MKGHGGLRIDHVVGHENALVVDGEEHEAQHAKAVEEVEVEPQQIVSYTNCTIPCDTMGAPNSYTA